MRARTVVATVALFAVVVAACGNAGTSNKDTTTTAGGGGSTTSTTAAGDQDKVHVPVTAPGVTDTEIHVGSVTATTNPLGGNEADFNDGIEAYFAMMNSTGGIYGRQLKLTSKRDDQTVNNQSQVQALISQDNVFAAFIATLVFSGSDLLAQAGMPTFTWNINPEFQGHDNEFANVGAICFTCAGPTIPYVAKQNGFTKIGLLAYGASVSAESGECAKGTEESFTKYGTGAQVVFVDDQLPFGVPDLSHQVSEMKQKGVQLVATCMDFNGTFTLAKEMNRQQLNAVQWLPNGYNPDFMKANGKYFEGSYVGTEFSPFEFQPQNKQVVNFLKWIAQGSNKINEMSFYGWIDADQFVTGLRGAGPHFSQAGVIKALNAGIYDPDGAIEPLDWRYRHNDPTQKGNMDPVSCFAAVQVKNNAFVPAFDNGGPWNCFDNTTTTLPAKPMTLDEARQLIDKGPL